jgi:phosphatidate cytidylyltransferase
MSAHEKTLVIFGGIVAVLILATAIAFVLQARHDPPSPGVQNLVSRIKAWWVIVVLLAVAFSLGRLGAIVLFALCSVAALREFVTLTPTRRGDHTALAASFFIVLPLQYYLAWLPWYGMFIIFIPVYVFLLAPILVAVRGDTTDFMARVAEVQWGLMIAVYCISHVPALLMLEIPGFEGRSALLVIFLVLVVQASDVLQYVFGKLFGRRRLAPNLSPGKTAEGAIGGIACASALGAALWWITPFTVGQAAVMAFLVSLMGLAGGLVMSAIKRDRGVKDWGWMIEGHGGMLDRLDSVIFAAPIFFHITRYWWTGANAVTAP